MLIDTSNLKFGDYLGETSLVRVIELNYKNKAESLLYCSNCESLFIRKNCSLLHHTTMNPIYSCGCIGKIIHNSKNNPTYYSWKGIIQRCTYENDKDYDNYGGRGITVCDEWLDFNNFLRDMGHRPGPNFSIDRTENDFGYFKDNCSWVTIKQQNRNRSGIIFTYDVIEKLFQIYSRDPDQLQEASEYSGIRKNKILKLISQYETKSDELFIYFTVSDILYMANLIAKDIRRDHILLPEFKYTISAIPRGGVPSLLAILNFLPSNFIPVNDITNANIIIDDLIDSGKTKERVLLENPTAKFYCLYKKLSKYCIFPWEGNSSMSIEDAFLRLKQYYNMPEENFDEFKSQVDQLVKVTQTLKTAKL
jgi:hypothetical protein